MATGSPKVFYLKALSVAISTEQKRERLRLLNGSERIRSKVRAGFRKAIAKEEGIAKAAYERKRVLEQDMREMAEAEVEEYEAHRSVNAKLRRASDLRKRLMLSKSGDMEKLAGEVEKVCRSLGCPVDYL